MDSVGTGEDTFTDNYYKYVDDIYRLCYSFMKNRMDAEDATQETFMKYYYSDREFESDKHLKAWLIVTASNHCKNLLKHWWRKKREDIDYNGSNDPYGTDSGEDYVEKDEILELVLSLPEKYKTAVFLYYYEGYDSIEISKIIGKPASTVRSYLLRARKLLKKKIEGNECYE